MHDDKKSADGPLHYLLISLLILTVFFLQYTFRAADDNRLTSWEWTFAQVDLIRFPAYLVLGMLCAFALSRSRRLCTRHALTLFAVSFGACVFFWSVPEVIVDASRYFTQAKHLEMYGVSYFFREWGRDIHAWTDMPLVSFFHGLIFRSLGESRTFIQVFNSTLFSLTIVCTYKIGKFLWDDETGFCGGVLLLGIPYLFSQVPLMLVDVPTMFFLTFSVFAFMKALEEGGAWHILSSFSVSCAIFSKYSAWLMLSVLPVALMAYMARCREQRAERVENTVCCPSITPKGTGKKYFIRALLVVSITGVVVTCAFIWKFDVISGQIMFLREYQAPGLKRWGESFASSLLFQVHPFITAAAVYSVIEAIRKRDPKFVIAAWLPLLVIVLQVRRVRYIMVIFPMLALMASYGLQRIRSLGLRRFLVYSTVSSAFTVALFSYAPFLKGMSMMNIRDAGGFLDSIRTETAEVIAIPSADTDVNLAVSVPILDLYTKKEILYQYDGSYTPLFEKIKESPLRFTWDYKNPGYYELPPFKKGGEKGPNKQNPALVIISNGHAGALPEHITNKLEGYERAAVFEKTEGIFEFNPFITIYLPGQ